MYSKILVAVDLRKDSRKVIKKAKALLKPKGKIHLLHVIEPSDLSLFSAIPIPGLINLKDMESTVFQDRTEKLIKLAQKFDVSEKNTSIEVGKASSQIKQKAIELKSDLIVSGTHGQSGFELLLGSTASGVLHGAPCDVLTVQMRVNKKALR
ncbi:universal stress protein [Kangiella sp. HZ709]|uniref:universal stress protein n=1 Tax=Kangiella sp. HZ709 TaxID=2666328 RepID=UPI0012AFB597|nr:universal stress protein [Kangiella sp. HZ709]MRX28426.1 universal stress protein [Kangiella sp. HZ709]